MNSYINKLKKFRLKFLLQQIFVNFVLLILLLIVSFITYTFVSNLLLSSYESLLVISIIYKVIITLLLVLFVVRSSLSFTSLKKIAQRIAQIEEGSKEIILAAFELEKAKKDFYSSDIQKATIKKANQITKNLGYSEIFPPQKVLWHIKILFISLVFILVFYLVLPGLCNNSLITLTDIERFSPKYDKKIEIKPGDATLLRGSNLQISIDNYNPNLQYDLFIKKNLRTKQVNLASDKYTFYNVTDTMYYWLKNEFASSDTFFVNTLSKPAIKELTLKYDYPEYANIPDKTEENASGNVIALRGTKITVNLLVNNDLKKHRIIFSDGETNKLDKINKYNYSTVFNIENTGTYHFLLVDTLNNQNQPIERNIYAEEDLSPTIEILAPARDKLLAKQLTETILFTSSDDFGLSKISIVFKKNNEEFKEETVAENITNSMYKDSFVFEVSDIDLMPGDVISYFLKVYDNCSIPDKQTGQSKTYLLKFPSIEELYEEIDKEQQSQSDNLSRAFKESEKNKKKFEQLRRKYLKQEEYEWQEKEDLKSILKKQEEMSKIAEQTAKEYKKFIEEVEKNKLASQETMEKLKELQKLMQDISTPELKEAMKDLQESIKKMKPEDMKEALKNFKFSQEKFLKRLENTLNILKKVKQEQDMQKLIQQANELKKLQDQLNKLTKERSENNQDLSGLSKKQEEISEKYQQLKKELEKQAKNLRENKESKAAEQLEKALSEAEQSKLSQQLQDAIEQLKKNQSSKASQTQNSISECMGKMCSSISKSQQMMQNAMQEKFKKLIKRTVENLLYYSKQQETILPREYGAFEILDREIEIYEGLQNSMKTLFQNPLIMFSINPGIMKHSASTFNLFENMFDALRNNRNYNVQKDKEEIFYSINKMLSDLLQSRGGSGQGGGGMQQLMQQLQQMSQGQKMANQLSMALFQQMMQKMGQNGKTSPRLSQEQRQMMERITANEQRIKENLERVLKDYPEAKKLLGDLESTEELLEEVVEKLRKGTIDEELLEKQQHIYSRLLDAQKSIHKRDFSQKRRAESPDEAEYSVPDSLKLDMEKIEYRDFLKEIYENYPEKYHNLIKKYMKQIQE